MEKNNVRVLTVSSMSVPHTKSKYATMERMSYKQVPAIRIGGKWLEDLGFHIGDKIQMNCEDNRIVITLI